MARVVVAHLADADIAGIQDETRRTYGYEAVVKFDASWNRLLDQVSEFPESGAPRPDLGAGVRIGLIKPFIVVFEYEVATLQITILRVLHERREIRSMPLRPSH